MVAIKWIICSSSSRLDLSLLLIPLDEFRLIYLRLCRAEQLHRNGALYQAGTSMQI